MQDFSGYPQSRIEAIATEAKQYFTGKPCPHGHVCLRWTAGGGCYECMLVLRRKTAAKFRQEHPDVVKARKAEWYRNNSEKVIAKVRARYHADPEKMREKGRQYAAGRRPEERKRASEWGMKNRERKAVSDKKWRAENPGDNRAHKACYRAARLKATPPWLTPEHKHQIKTIYRSCVTVSKSTSVPHEVDHIVPLQGKTVCGLHVPWNLRVIEKVENNRRPRIWAEM